MNCNVTMAMTCMFRQLRAIYNLYTITIGFLYIGGNILQQQTGQSGHQTRRATALQRAQSVASQGATSLCNIANPAGTESDATTCRICRRK